MIIEDKYLIKIYNLIYKLIEKIKLFFLFSNNKYGS